MPSFVNTTLLTEEPSYKFILKYDTQKLKAYAFCKNATHTVLAMCNCV